MIKFIPAAASGPISFAPLPSAPQLSLTLAKAAKLLNNAEKGNAADEKYLGEQQNLEQKARWFESVGQFEVYDLDDLAEMGFDDYDNQW
jgi:hypothetical protein